MTNAPSSLPSASLDTTMLALHARQMQNTGNLSSEQLRKTKEAAKGFEAVFLSEMMSHMFAGISTNPVTGGGQGEDMFRGMLIQEYGKQMAKGNGIGISEQLQKMMIQMQQQ